MSQKVDPALDRRMVGEFVKIPAGEFMMGSDAETYMKPVHKVIISKAFAMGKYEVTQEQWQAVMGNNPSYFICRWSKFRVVPC